MPSTVLRLCYAFFSQKVSRLETTRIYNGKNMPHSDLSFRALSVLHTSRYLFNKYGFHKVGVDRIIESSKTPKATFYNYFHSKERLIEMSLTFQKMALNTRCFPLLMFKKI